MEGLNADPELATNDEWRGIMRRARATRGWSQAELAQRVGTSQNMISNIESGSVRASQFVMPICEQLGINPPMFYLDEDDRSWIQLGRVLRARDMEVFRRALALVEVMAETASRAASAPDPTSEQ